MVQVHAEEIKDFKKIIYFLIWKDESCLLMPRFEPRDRRGGKPST